MNPLLVFKVPTHTPITPLPTTTSFLHRRVAAPTRHQSMDSKILREYITQEGNRHEVAARPPVAVTNAVSWRTEGIKHRKNEIFLDVVEKLNLLVSSNGTVCIVRRQVSQLEELKLGARKKKP